MYQIAYSMSNGNLGIGVFIACRCSALRDGCCVARECYSSAMPIAEDLARIALQEQELQFTRFDEETAWRLGGHVRALAVARKLSLVVDVRRFGQPLFYSALPGTTPDNVEWVRRKGNVVARFHRSSYAIGREMEEKKSNLSDRYGLPIAEYASHGGSFPLRVVGAGVIGSVTVSGLPERADHQLAVEALCAELGRPFDTLRLE
jgi:uncharacterized protein (UPF0303 family)